MKNRIIKFRAWDGEKKIMYDWNWVEISSAGIRVFDPEEGLVINDEDGNSLIALQFTGLLDKNGKEIYDGDILKFPNKPNDPKFHTISCVRWVNNKARFNPHSVEKAEIIGNMFENSELLKN